MVYEYRRMYDLLLMIDEYERRYDEHQGLILGSVTTAIPYQEQHQQWKKKLPWYEQQAHLVNLIDPSVSAEWLLANHQVIDGIRIEHMHISY